MKVLRIHIVIYTNGGIMKKYWIIPLVLLILSSLAGCAPKKVSIETPPQTSLSSEQQKAVQNSIEYIKNSELASKDRIDTSLIKIDTAEENTWQSVYTDSGKAEESTVDTTDWIITLGDRSGFDFAVIVCDSTTSEVIGYMPME
ncbi:hypothetical protein SAMN05421804_105175 [Proteiniclasticum ruminis]|uniref:Uncharacterized protein n=2 Tax=Proteiniclasticum ruminis TaxID=398199 RepID=A0A1G8PS70_9CLOT|nr:hypothetical protein SAMN05421804_105175 [Proteiniclasticum ruminis]